MRSKAGLLAAVLITLFMAGWISVMSVKSVSEENAGVKETEVIFGGKARLRNTIEIPKEEAASLVLEYRNKNIYVYPSEESKIIVKEYLYSSRPQALASVEREEGKKVSVIGGNSRVAVLFGFFQGERIEVYIPEKSLENLTLETRSGNITSETDSIQEKGNLRIKAGSGNIRWKDTAGGSILLEAGSGNIKAGEIRGESEIRTGSGNISAELLAGRIEVSAGSGNINLRACEGEGTIRSGSGNISAESCTLQGTMEIEAGSGNVRLNLPGKMEFGFQAESRSGNISTDFDDALTYSQKGSSAEGAVGDAPRGQLLVKTRSGNIRVTR